METAAESVVSFAGLLRQFRTEARLTQEELAEAAGVSPRSVSDLERGINRTARKDTAVLLAAPASAPETARPRRSPGCAGTCRWRSGCSPGSFGIIRPGPGPNSPPASRPPATGWPACARRTCRSRPRSTCPTPNSARLSSSCSAGGRLPPAGPPGSAPQLATSGEAAAWLEAERPNLHAAVNYAATQEMPRHAVAIAAAMGGFLRARGHWDQAREQYQTALAAAREAADRPAQAGVLDELGLLQQLTSDYRAAAATLAEAIGLFGELGDLPGQAYALNHLGLVQVDQADYPAAAASHRRALALAHDAGDRGGRWTSSAGSTS
jgi:DNA-binding XRE family transcriptional regulator